MYRDDEMWAHGLHDALPSEEDEEDEDEELEAGAELDDDDGIGEEVGSVQGVEKVVEDKKPEEKETVTAAEVKKLARNGVTKPSWANIAKIAPFRPQTRAK
jgi:hypothetical protein